MRYIRFIRRFISYLKMRLWMYVRRVYGSFAIRYTITCWIKEDGSEIWKFVYYRRGFSIAKFHFGYDDELSGRIQHVAYYKCRLSLWQLRALKRGVSPMSIQADNLVAYFPLNVVEVNDVYKGETIH